MATATTDIRRIGHIRNSRSGSRRRSGSSRSRSRSRNSLPLFHKIRDIRLFNEDGSPIWIGSRLVESLYHIGGGNSAVVYTHHVVAIQNYGIVTIHSVDCEYPI